MDLKKSRLWILFDDCKRYFDIKVLSHWVLRVSSEEETYVPKRQHVESDDVATNPETVQLLTAATGACKPSSRGDKFVGQATLLSRLDIIGVFIELC